MSAPERTAMEALVDGLVDYAGLFPPAALLMRDAVARYASYRADADRAILARFVLPVGRLDELVSASERVEISGAASAPWMLAVLAGPADAAVLDAFNVRHGSRLRIDTVEAKATTATEVAALAAALAPRFTVYVELPVREDPDPLLAAVGAHGLRAKIRTGGVTTDAFPAPHEVLRFLAGCVRRRVPFKATAGLHHPITGEYALTYAPDSVRGPMYGFLNLFLAALLLHDGHEAQLVAPLLEEREPSAIRVTPGAISWRGLGVSTDAITIARSGLAGSFGSCSFDEPVRDLAALDLLPILR